MAFPTAVNNQITDSVSQSGVQVLADAPAVAMASHYQATSHASALAMQNAVALQQMGDSLRLAISASCARVLLGNPITPA
jgi:hypothetical protein